MSRKITFPHAGNYYIAFKYILGSFGYEVLMPPLSNTAALDVGVKNAPSQACLPFKITLGNVLQGIEMGADTVMMIGGRMGICRLAYFSEMYRKIAFDKGNHVELLNLKLKKELWTTVKRHNPEIKLKSFFKYCYGFWLKLKLVELIRSESLKGRPYEIERGTCTRVAREMLEKADDVNTIKAMKALSKEIGRRFSDIPLDMDRKVLKIGMIGEFFLLIDQFSTMNLEEFLGDMGILVTPSLSFTEFFLGSVKQIRFLDHFLPTVRNKVNRLAKPYIDRAIGGHAMQTLGEAIRYKHEGYDGVIHLYPFSCMPEVVADPMLAKVSDIHDLSVLSLTFDEHTGEAGLKTRLEAFIDMIRRKEQETV